MTLPLWPDSAEAAPTPPVPPKPRWTPRCEDCGRRIWSAASLKRRFGRLLGGRCHRKHVRAHRRLRLSIRVTPPGDIPGQTDLLEL